MIDSFYTAAVGTIQTQKGFDVVSNNIANANTNGFKQSRASFADLLYTNLRPSQTDTNLKVGHSAKLKKTDVLHTNGAFQPTGRDMDYAINGSGYFAIETNDGIKYTRSGNFEKSYIDGECYLTAMQGGFVLDSKGQKIVITTPEPPAAKTPEELALEAEEKAAAKKAAEEAAANGTELPESPAEEKIKEIPIDVGVYNFDNTDGLAIEGGLFFTPTANSGEAKAAVGSDLTRTGYLESSNVDMAVAMTDVIQMQRAFQFNSRMVQVSDEVMQTINSLR